MREREKKKKEKEKEKEKDPENRSQSLPESETFQSFRVSGRSKSLKKYFIKF